MPMTQLLHRGSPTHARRHLPPAFVCFLRVQSCFAAILQINTIFMNTFLLRATGESLSVMRFNIVLGVVQPVAMLLAVVYSRKVSAVRSQRIGLVLYGLAYALLIWLGEGASTISLALAALQSAAAGFYYVTYVLQLLSYAKDEERDMALGVMGMIGGVLALSVPLVSGALVSVLPGFNGYRALFSVGLLLALSALAFSLRLAPVTAMQRGKTHILESARALIREKPARAAMGATCVSGMYAGAMSFFLNMLLYALVESEWLVSVNAFLGGGAAILASFLYGRLVKPPFRAAAMYVVLSALLVLAVPLFFLLNTWSIMLFNVALCLATPFFSNPPVTAYMRVVGALPSLRENGAEVHALREFYYATGRVLGILLAMALPATQTGSVLVIVALIAVQFAAAHLTSVMSRV